MNILYIDGVGPFGGASRSLFEVMRGFPKDEAAPYFVMQQGTAAAFYDQVAREIISTRGLTRFDHSRASHYRGVRWIVPLREIVYLPFAIAALLKARRRFPKIDLIHANEIHEIIPALIAKRLFRAPLIVHTRSLMYDDSRLWRTRWLHRRLRRDVDQVIAIDEGVRATLPADVPVEVIHNSFAASPAGQVDAEYFKPLENLRATSLKVGFVGNLHRHKGLGELLEAAKLVRAAGADVQFFIVGGTTTSEGGLAQWVLRKLGLAQNMRGELGQALADAGLASDFVLLGPTADIHAAYERMDVLAFPSHYDAPGRPVFEAAFFGVPSIVAVREPRPDTLVDGETGIAVPEPDPRLVADAILRFERDRAGTKRMGENARALAHRNFRPEVNAPRLLSVYRKVLARYRQSPVEP